MLNNSGIVLKIGVIFIILIVGVFHPVFFFDFLIGWDDQWFVTNMFTEGGMQKENLFEIFAEYYRGQYAPLNQLYYTFLYQFFGYDAQYFHFFSLLIHLINTMLVYQFTLAIWRRLYSENCIKLALASACLFAILPINVEPVSWVSASKVLIYAFFYLLGILFYIRYLVSKSSLCYYLTLVAFLFSFLGKEQAVTLPLALILLDWFFERDMRSKDVMLEKIPVLVLSILFGLISIESQGFDSSSRNFYPLHQRVPLVVFTIIEYFSKTVIPINLSYLYPFPFQNGENVPWWMWLYVILLPVVIWYFKTLKSKLVHFCVFFFLLHILLVCNFFSLARHSIIADRYTYVASIGLCMLVVFIFHSLFLIRRKLALAIGSIYFFTLVIYSHSYTKSWKNVYALKERLKSTIESRPDFNKLRDGKD